MMPAGDMVNAMTVDVEDYFQVQALADRFERAGWDNQQCRIDRNVRRIIALFAEHRCRATFFTLAWVARRYRSLVRDIAAAGHEVASHGLDHVRADAQQPAEFRHDVRESKRILEDVIQAPVSGYRAASFSIGPRNAWAFEVLAEEGYAYSSSIYPIRHDIYGDPDAPRFAYRPNDRDGIIEAPISTVRVFGRNFPCGGGGYFRLLPYVVSRWQIRRVNRHDRQPSIFYFHPWEIDPEQPRARNLPIKTRVRHYTNLRRMEGRVGRLLRDFRWDRLDTVLDVRPQGRP